MSQESFMLKWKFFNENASSTLHDVATENNFTDITLVSDELKSFKVHKFVLSANSPVMKNMLMMNQHSHPLIYLKGIQGQELECLLQIMYIGKSTFQTSR